MKRISVFILALAGGICSYADVVDRNAANTVAEQFLASSVSCVYEEKCVGTKSTVESSPAFYIFENSSGWVIVAGDDCAVPVLGYGDGHFPYDDMPANMRSFLEGLGQEILWAREKKLSADSGTAAKWKNAASLRSRTKAGAVIKGPLTADITWTQNSPYNSKAPRDSTTGAACPAGCGATAFAIIARYHEWPERGVDEIPAYITLTNKFPMPAIDIDGYEYDWKNMPKSSKAVFTDNQKDSIGTLMLHIGCGMKMDYESSGSGTSIDRTQSFAINHFSYKKSCVVLYRDEYSPDEWYSLMRHEIECDRPVFYAAQGSSGGHAMVLDGFDDNTGMISVNWGWGSGGKGWYVLNTMQNIKDGWWDRGNTSALIGLEPDRSGDSQKFGRIQISYGLTLGNAEDNIKKINKFDVCLNNLSRKDKTDATKAIDLKVMLLDRDSKAVGQVSEDVKHIEFTSGGSVVNVVDGGTVSCEISGQYVIGDRLSCFYSSTPGVWYPLGSTYENVNSTIGAYKLDMIVLPRNLKKGVVFYPQVLLGGWKTLKKVDWYYDRKAMDPKYPSVFLETGEHSIKAKVTYSDDTVRWLYADFTVE